MSTVGKTIRVVAAILTYGDEILVCRRAQHKVSAGLWEFPGGKIENGEDPVNALKRELGEELGIDAEIGRHWNTATTVVDDMRIQLECYLATCPVTPTTSADHDLIRLLPVSELVDLDWAQPNLPAVRKLTSMQPNQA